MKRSASTIACICLFLALSAGSVWAEWEGNAGMAAASDFPQAGMYARSDMFPKNTVVEIRNLETEITVRAIITGSAGVPGLVAVLSPVTASALRIRSGSVSRVRISVPSPVAERPAPGTVTSGTALETADPDVNPAAAAAAAPARSALPAAPAPAAAPAIPLSALAGTAADPLVPLREPAPAVPEAPAAPESPAAPQTLTAAAAVFAAEPAVPETPAAAEAPPVSEPAVASAGASPEVPPASAEPAPAQSPAGPVVFIEEPGLEAPAVPPVPATAPGIAAAEPVPETSPEAAPEGGFAAVLVPAEPNPPSAPDLPLPSAIPEAEPVMAAVPAERDAFPVSVPEAPALPGTPVPAAAAAIPPPVAPSAEQIRLPFISSFSKGSYYVQIASYTDPANAQKLVDSYGKKYPVAVERAATKGGDVLKVFIGPVKKDEYGAVLERFKSLGFKDAFVKKGQ